MPLRLDHRAEPPRTSPARRTLVASVTLGILLAACGGAGDETAAGSDGSATDTPSPTATDAPSPTATDEAPTAGDAVAAGLSFDTFDGDTATLADFHGDRPLVVNFWASWCPPCVAEMPDIEEVHQQFDGQVNFLGINTQDEQDEARDLAEQTGVTYPLALDPDGDLFGAFGVFGMPSTFLVDTAGQIVERHTGILTGEDLTAMIEESFGGTS